jgi:hypothetical protein
VSIRYEDAAGRTFGSRSEVGGFNDHWGAHNRLRDNGPGDDSLRPGDRGDFDSHGDNWKHEDLSDSKAPHFPGHAISDFGRDEYFGTDGAPLSFAGGDISVSTPWGGGENVVVVAPVPVKILIPAYGSTLVVIAPKALPADAGHNGGMIAHDPADRQPGYERGKGSDAPQAVAEQREQTRAAERAEQRQVRQAAAREERPAAQNTPAAGPADPRANQDHPTGQSGAAVAHPAATGAATAETSHSGGVAAAVAAVAGHVVDVAPVARAAGAIAMASQGAAAVVTVDHAAAAAWQGIVGRVEAVVAKVAGMVEAVASVDGAFDAVAVAADVSDVGSGLLYLPTGPTMFLGLAPMTAASARASSWWPSQQAWRVAEAVSLVIAVAGYGYCRADAERRRGRPVPMRSGIVATRRPSEGL